MASKTKKELRDIVIPAKIVGALETMSTEDVHNLVYGAIYYSKTGDRLRMDGTLDYVYSEWCDDIEERRAKRETKSGVPKHKYGEYGNVRLTDEQYEAVQEKYPLDYDDLITEVDSYMERSGRTYKNFLAAIDTFARRSNRRPAVSVNVTVNSKEDESVLEFFRGLKN